MDHRYLILFPVPRSVRTQLIDLMNEIGKATRLRPPYKNLPPHVTFHRPITGINEKKIIDVVRSASLQIEPTRISVSGIHNFGKQYMVLPVHATLSVARLWVRVNDLLSCLPNYEHGKFDNDNTLHITVAGGTSAVFDEAWPKVKQLPIPQLHIPVERMEIYKSPIGRHFWRRVEKFEIK